jgi:acyl carrier protein
MLTQEWLQQKIAEETGLPIADIAYDTPFEQFSMDSLSVITLAYELESFTGKETIDPSVFSEFNTINKLTAWLEQQKQ